MGDKSLLPRWECHKTVFADKIASFSHSAAGGKQWLLACGLFVDVSADLDKRCRAIPNDFGYYVQYEDGYESWSPSKAFEEGYTRIS